MTLSLQSPLMGCTPKNPMRLLTAEKQTIKYKPKNKYLWQQNHTDIKSRTYHRFKPLPFTPPVSGPMRIGTKPAPSLVARMGPIMNPLDSIPTASKSGVMGVTRLMANEWAKHNINVNAIAPGYMATNNTQQLRADEQRSAEILDRIPAGRWGLPSDLMGPIVFLASSASDYVNGYTIAVDGGWLAR